MPDKEATSFEREAEEAAKRAMHRQIVLNEVRAQNVRVRGALAAMHALVEEQVGMLTWRGQIAWLYLLVG